MNRSASCAILSRSATGGGNGLLEWALSTEDQVHHIDLDSDGTTELLLKNSTRIGVIDWVNEVPRLVWSASDFLEDVWPLS